MDSEKKRPEWAPQNAGEGFASSVIKGVKGPSSINQGAFGATAPRPQPTAEEFANAILSGNRMMLSRAITIIESNAEKHFALGQEIIRLVLPHTGKAARVGITGVPGAGKSTFIDALGSYLCDARKKVAVLAVDPSSAITRGSILGDKVRMERLSKRSEAYIRPSPSGGTLGGVGRKSRETMLLCEAAGFDTLLVETVGVGQSETLVRSMVDFFLVLVITGAGDELQGIKKGVIETADAILVNKADGDNLQKAQVARSEYERVLHYLRPATPGWVTKAYTASALTGEGVADIWRVTENFMEAMGRTGILEERRSQQMLTWVRQVAKEQVENRIFGNAQVKQAFLGIEERLLKGAVSPSVAAMEMIGAVENEMFAAK